MGKVYRGVQLTLNRSVAIKVIHPHLLHDPSVVARFHAEARAASRLNHPNSVSVIDFGKSEEGLLYLVMEYLEGKDLATLHLEEGPLPFNRIVGILRGVTSVMIEAHALGIVHRDLKPENIFVRRRAHQDEVKVLDFGLAKMHHAPPTQATLRGHICGTPDYMSPEQARGENVDGRSDIYSLGVILFELLTDRLPYPDENPTKVLLRHIRDPVPDPRVVAPGRGIPDALA
ncbi:MAG: serine/threonine-protein kinase, partial [Sandaracinaceae bacterium]|nr:serine/threonine-protein kinase [Sandaracinaceae bacterium]